MYELQELVNSNTTSSSDSTSNTAKVLLPALEIKKFDVNSWEWIFLGNIQTNCPPITWLSDTQKLSYLLEFLEGEAYRSLRGLLRNANNYSVAIKILQDKYDDKKVIISNLICKIHSLRPVNLQISNRVNYLIETLTTNIRALEAIGVDPVNSMQS